MRLLLGGLLLMLSCTKSHPFPPLPNDPRLGVEVLELPPFQRTVSSATVSADGLYVVTWAAGGFDRKLDAVAPSTHVVKFELSSGQVSELPSPPVLAADGQSIAFGLMHGAGAALRIEGTIVLWDGAWFALPARDDFAQGTRGIAVRSRSDVVVLTGEQLLRWDGSQWNSAPVESRNQVLGPDDESTIVFVENQSDRVVARFFDRATLTEAAALDLGAGTLGTSPQNGTPRDFVVPLGNDGQLELVRVSQRAVLTRSALRGKLLHRRDGPGPLLVEATDADEGRSFTRVEGSTSAGLMLQTGGPRLDCACDRSLDVSCNCVPRKIALVLAPGAMHGEGPAPLVFVDTIDAQLKVFVRSFSLPQAGTPFAPAVDGGLTAEELCAAEGKVMCGADCVDLQSDVNDCGQCGTACNGLSCVSGVCRCLPGESLCNGACLDTRTDLQNCGGCGRVCVVGQFGGATCVSGQCQFTCAPGYLNCSGVPCDTGTLTDPAHCGGCGVACSNSQTCQQGRCTP